MKKRDNEFLKKCYIICQNAEWDKDSISKEAMNVNMTYDELVEYAREYVDNGFIGWYDDLSDNSKKTFNQSAYTNLMKKYSKIIPNFNGTMHEVEKYCYEESFKLNFDDVKMRQLADKLGLIFDSLLKKVRSYAKSINTIDMVEEKLKISREEKNRREYLKNNPELVNLIKDLLAENDPQRIIKICEDSLVDVNSALLRRITYCVGLLYPNDYENKLSIINRKTKIYRDYANNQSKNRFSSNIKEERARLLKELLPYAQKYVAMFIESDCETVRTFCNLYGVPFDIFGRLIETLQYHDQDLYQGYISKMNGDNTFKYSLIVEKVKMMVPQIKNGISGRNFDIIDYYSYTRVPLDDVIRIIKDKLMPEETRIFRRFTGKYSNLKELNENNINYILNEITEVDCDRNKDGDVIKGTGRIITREEKIKIMNYIKNLQIPLNMATYRSCFDRYTKGYLAFEEEKKSHK